MFSCWDLDKKGVLVSTGTLAIPEDRDEIQYFTTIKAPHRLAVGYGRRPYYSARFFSFPPLALLADQKGTNVLQGFQNDGKRFLAEIHDTYHLVAIDTTSSETAGALYPTEWGKESKPEPDETLLWFGAVTDLRLPLWIVYYTVQKTDFKSKDLPPPEPWVVALRVDGSVLWGGKVDLTQDGPWFYETCRIQPRHSVFVMSDRDSYRGYGTKDGRPLWVQSRRDMKELLGISDDGSLQVFRRADGELAICDLPSTDIVRIPGLREAPDVAFAPDGQTIFCMPGLRSAPHSPRGVRLLERESNEVTAVDTKTGELLWKAQLDRSRDVEMRRPP